jgi:ATP-dependent helicase/nuclease subunit A
MEIASVCLGKLPTAVEAHQSETTLEDITEAPEEIEAETVLDSELADELCRRFGYEYPTPHLTTLPEKMSVSLMSPTILDGTDGESLYIGPTDEEERAILPAFVTGKAAEESAKRGIATHLFMQFCSLENLRDSGARAELERLRGSGFLSDEDAKRVRLREIEAFRESDLFYRMLSAKKIHRELRFNVLLPASEFTAESERKKTLSDRDILVQGVIDCIIENADGSITLCDYKTDRLTLEELADRNLAEEKLRTKHSMQLGLYSMAIEKIFGKRPSSTEIYSLPLGDTVKI